MLSTDSGTTRFTSEARKTPLMIARGVIWPPIQSIVVVTSPIADQAPPALGGITIVPARNSGHVGLPGGFLINEMMTMVVVKLAKRALRKKVKNPRSHIRVACFLVRMSEV